MKLRPVTELSGLPTWGYGLRSPVWWGTLGFMALEGMGFALAVGAYLYLYHLAPAWPMADEPPRLLPGTVMTLVLLASAWPNAVIDRAAKAQDLPKVRRLLLVMSAIGLATLAIRWWEFTQLHVRWDQNAYGSLLWLLLGLHYTHLITDVGDTVVLTALMFTKHGRGKRFSDVSDNAFYWYFVIAAWLPIYLLVYGVPRW